MPPKDEVIYTHPVGIEFDGRGQVVTIALARKDYTLVRDELKRDPNLWASFRAHIDGIREMDQLQIDGPAAFLSTEHFRAICQCLEKHIKYGGALCHPFFEHARKVGLD